MILFSVYTAAQLCWNHVGIINQKMPKVYWGQLLQCEAFPASLHSKLNFIRWKKKDKDNKRHLKKSPWTLFNLIEHTLKIISRLLFFLLRCSDTQIQPHTLVQDPYGTCTLPKLMNRNSTLGSDVASGFLVSRHFDGQGCKNSVLNADAGMTFFKQTNQEKPNRDSASAKHSHVIWAVASRLS